MFASSPTAIASASSANATGWPWKLPFETHRPVLGEDERVVRRRVQLGGGGSLDVGEQIAGRAVHLRRAAQRVRVLHVVAPAVRLEDRRVVEQPEDVRRRSGLARQRPELVDAREEALARALERLDRERAGDVSRLREAPRPHEAERGERAHELRAVDEREPFLRLQAQRLEARPRERVGAGEQLAVDARSPSPTSGSARWASGARSPLAPTEPRLGTLGSTPRLEAVEQELGDLDARPE